ncbi:MAG: T9SS type A sorting domain-containing protein [Bacteroidetes bacterium]|nr:T9SS type A sorting domain-containing protein [Bacteroidota bacterium]
MLNRHIPYFLVYFAIISLTACQTEDKVSEFSESDFPNENFFLQRAYPDDFMDIKAYESGMAEARIMGSQRGIGFDAEWTVQGPGNIGARVNTMAVNPQNENIIFAGFSSGGLWRTIDAGQNWEPVFDTQTWPSIGVVTFDPTNPQTIYVGTGDPNISFYPMLGDGIYKSTDGGDTWTHIGLDAQRVITKIVVNPANPNIIFASSMGMPFIRDNERGLYRTTDGGANWQQVLFISDQAGVTDLVMDPFDPNVLYASGWDRVRSNQESTISGPGAKVFKTVDGGDTWTQLTNGLPSDNMSRTGLAISKLTPGLVYSMFVGTDLELAGIFKTTDAGDNWEPIDIFGAEGSMSGQGWYFSQLRTSPTNDDELYLLGLELYRGYPELGFWEQLGPPWWTYEVHADKHDLVVTNSGNLYLATDGGAYKSMDAGNTWQDIENIPTTQFYRVAFNPHEPENYYGGAQDNGTTGGNANAPNDWPRIYGGDGFQAIFHPTDPLVFYAETQNGGLVVTDDGGGSFYDAKFGIDENDRRNWDMPVAMSNHNPEILYTGTYRMYRSTEGTIPFWEAISDDLTDGLIFNPRHHNISAISESPLEPGLVYVGTSDGNVHRNDGDDFMWTNISAGLPDRYVTDVEASPTNQNWVYVTHSGYRDNEFIPRVHRSTNQGQTWEDISSNLPNIAVNNLFVLPGHGDSVLFVATDAGIYATLNGGQEWSRLGTNMPYIPSFDLDWNPVQNTLIAGTFARSIMTYPIDSLLTQPVSAVKNNLAALKDLKISPNPATDKILVTASLASADQVTELAIFDLHGRQFGTSKTTQEKQINQSFEVGALPAGQYFLRLKSGDKVGVSRFIKQSIR